MSSDTPARGFKPKKSVALSGVAAGNTALCTVGRSGTRRWEDFPTAAVRACSRISVA